MRRFVGLDLGESAAPDETTIWRFRHLPERNDLGKALFAYVLEHLERHGIKVGKGTIVDASIICAPPSTKNKDRAREFEMHQTKKGKQWFFGMKAHIGVESRTKVIHAVAASAANVHDATCLGQLLHGEETEVWGDSADQGQGGAHRPARPECAGHDPPTLSAQRRGRRAGAGEEPGEVEHAGQGRASVSGHQAYLRLREDALPGAGQERQPVVRRVRADELVPHATAIVARHVGEIRPIKRRSDENGARTPDSSTASGH